MLIRLFEYFLINIFNRALRRWEGRARQAPLPEIEPPPDHIVIGHVIPPAKAPAPNVAAAPLPQSGIVSLSPDARRRHLYILGALGVGKSNLLLRLIDDDIQSRRAFCVIDLRGDLVDRILLRLANTAPAPEWRQRLLLVDMRHTDHVVGFNPLLGEGESYHRALHVLGVLQEQSGSWGVQLEETLRNCLIALAESGWSLLEIGPLLSNAPFRAQVLSQVTDSQVRIFFERFELLSRAHQLEWTASVLNKVSPFLSLPQLRLMFGTRQAFSFRTLLDQQPGMIILISLAVDRLYSVAHRVGGLFVSAFESAIMSRADQPEGERVQAHLYVDEFEAMATERFESLIVEGRRFGCGLCLCHQNISQLSPKLRDTLRNIVHTQVYFQTGASDAAVLAKEVTAQESREEVRATLISQGVGEAYLVRRGQPSIRMRVLHSRDPQVNAADVKAVREASFATYARPRAEVAQELAAREEHLKALGSPSPSSKPAKNVQPIYEIEHGKTASFKPRSRKPKDDPHGS